MGDNMANNTTEIDLDVPPLEDCSEALQKVLNLREVKSTHRNTSTVSSAQECTSDQSKQRVSDKTHSSLTDTTGDGFGGMKKGFLFNTKPKSSATSCTSLPIDKQRHDNDNDGIPFIKPNKEADDNKFKFSEVQQSMKVDSAFSLNKDWMTDDLLERVQSRPNLLQRLADPVFMGAIAEFQTNPQAALAKYHDNVAVQSFLKEFCGLVGDHFSKLGVQEEQVKSSEIKSPIVQLHSPDGAADLTVVSSKSSSKRHTSLSDSSGSDDDARVKDILADTGLREILLDSRIQQLMEALRNDANKAQMILQRADPELKWKIGRLVQSGLLQFQT